MRHFTIFFICTFWSSYSFAQIRGRIVDSLSNAPISLANVSLISDSGKALGTVSSDSLGYFSLIQRPGNSFAISISRVGYSTKHISKFDFKNSTMLDLGEIKLVSDEHELTGVTVTGRKPLVEKSTDGIVYNAQQDQVTAGGTAIDVLKRTPMVSVGQDGTPSLRGSSNIRIFIDDKPADLFASSVADALRQIPAEDVIKVEVILYPSAKYDAEGTDGVINITTRKRKFNGTNGTINANLGLRYQYSNMSLDLKKDKWILSTNLGAYAYHNKNSAELLREDSEENEVNQNSNSTSNGRAYFIGGNLIYELDSLSNIYGGYRFRHYNSGSNKISQNQLFSRDSILTEYQSEIENLWDNNFNSFNLGYSGKSKNKWRDAKALVSYFSINGHEQYESDQVREENVDYSEHYMGHARTGELTFQFDLNQKLSSVFNFEAGLKSNFRKVVDSNQYSTLEFSKYEYELDSARSNEFNFRREIYATYTNFIFTFKGLQMRLGGRYEQTKLHNVFKDSVLMIPDYKNFVPFFLINKSLGDKQTIKFNFSQQILRPYYGYLNPAIDYSDSLNIEFGNPYLKPEITNKYELGYNGNIGKVTLNASIFYTHVQNGIENIRYPIAEGIFANTYRNIGKRDGYGTSGNLNWRKGKFSLVSNYTIRYLILKSIALNANNKGFQVNAGMTANYKLNHGYSVELLINYNSRSILLQGYRDGWKYFFLSVNKKINKEKITISLRAETYNRNILEDLNTDLFSQITNTKYQNFSLMLGLTWKFGKKEIKMPTIQQGTSD
ncbi:MAG: hypothetical protein C5B52_06325 [Bacteroidetes bacterium]|nr:MAG: hypothetical protein C5B52_06325 [Bacteroidota bacterium]